MRLLLRFIFTSVILLSIHQQSLAQGGDNAAAATGAPITLPFAAAGTTCGHVDDYNPISPYGIALSGKDWLYYFCAPTNGTIDVMLNNAYDYAPGAFIYSVTPNAGGSNWFATSFTGGLLCNTIVSFTATAGTCYYIMIDNDRFDDGFGCFPYNITIQYHTPPPASPLQPACTNIGYDNGNLGGWNGTTGAVSIGGAGAPTPNYNPQYFTTSPTQQVLTSGGVDAYGGFPQVNPSGSSNSMRLGDFGVFGATNEYGPSGIPGGGGATMEQKFQVTASNALFVYYYAVVIQDAGSNHTSQEQPFFKTDVFDCLGNPVVCGQYLVTGGPGIPGFSLAAGTTDVYYKNWSPVAVDLTSFIGTCVTVRYTVGDCTRGAHFAYAYVDATCNPLAITGINKVCPTKSTVLSAPVGLFTYSWTPGGLTTQSVTVTPTTTTTYTCELTSYTNCKTFLSYSVSLFPNAIVSSNASTVCAGTAAALTTTVNNGAGSYTWAPSGGNSSSASVTPPASTIFTVTYSDVNGCQDTALSRVTVNPIPSMLTPTNVAACHNATIAASAFSSTVAGTTFSWTNTNTSVGLSATGSGNTPGFTGVNTGASPVSAIVSVTPTANNCVGPPVSYTITVNPIPNANAVPSATYCSASAVPATAFSGSVTATTYSWANTNTTIGLGASGLGNTPGFTAANAGSGPISGVITVTPTANTCVGIPTDYTVVVNPIPTVNAVPSATYCSGIAVPATTFTGSVLNTTYNWANSNTAIGLAAASGINTVTAFNSSNLTTAPISGVITVTPTANTCTGTPTSYTLLVNPIPNVNAVTSSTYCSGIAVPATVFTGSVTGTLFNWVNSNTTIGLGANGTGNTPGFTATNAGSGPISGVITVTPSANTCTGTPTSYTVVVNPIPTVNAVPSATYCSGIPIPATTFTGSVLNTTYNWANSNTTIGLATAAGTGTVPSFTSSNLTTAPISGVITVTPTANTCTGTPTSYTISVNPIPNVNAVTSSTYCSGIAVPATVFTGSVTGTLFNWVNSNTTIGLATASGVATVPSFNSSNLTATPISGVITVTPSANTCTGTPTSYTILVNPIPTVNAVPSATYCNGAAVPATAFTGSVAGTTFNWANTNTTVGLGASGVGNTPAFNATNLTLAPISGVITVSPSANSCTGTPTNYTVLVNPTPSVLVPPNAAYCAGVTVPISTFTSNIAGANLNWTNTSPSIGLSASGLGNPPSFISTNGTASPIVGVISVTPTANSCVGTPVSFSITVNPSPLAPTVANPTLCPSSSATLTATAPGGTYKWYDAPVAGTLLTTSPTYITPSLTITTNYYVNTTNASGCISPLTTVTVTILNFLPVSASPNKTICVGATASLSVTPNGVGYVYSWDSPAAPAFSTIYNPTVSPVATTIYSVTVTSPNGCTGTNTTQVTVNPLPISNPGNPIAFCSGQSGTLGAATQAGYTYTWTPTTGLSNANLSSPTVSLTNFGATPALNNYTLNVSLNGCQASNSVQVTVNPIPVSNAGAPIRLCAGQTGVIGAANNTGYTYAWSPAANLSSSSVSNPTVTGVNGGATNTSVVYTVTTVDALTTCQSNAIVTVTVLPLPTVNVGAVPTVCAGTPNVPLNGAIGGSAISGFWSGGGGSFSPNATTLGASYSPSAAEFLAGSVTLTLTAIATSPCANVNTPVVLNFYNNPVPNFTVDVPKGCPIHCVKFTDLSTIPAPDAIQGWSWNFGDGGTSNVQNPPHCYDQTGIYTVTLTVTTNHLCSATLVIPAMIEVYAKPVASFYPNPSLSTILDPLVYFQNTSQGAVSYNWSFGDSNAPGTLNSSTLVNPNHTYSVTGQYEVTLVATSIHGCVDITKMTVEIQPEFVFYIPNAFTPTTTEGHNDFFTGFGIGIEQFELWIFDRWGVNIFYTNDMEKGWDGTVQGTSNPVQQDVYVWKVKIKDVFNRPHNYVGHVTVLR